MKRETVRASRSATKWRRACRCAILALTLAVLSIAVQPADASRPPTSGERAALSGTFPARCLLIRVSLPG
jgi:hypothetical protein